MTKKSTKINNFLKISIASAVLLTLGLTQTKSQNILNLFDGVVKSDASTGNVTPTYNCYASNGSYRQYAYVPTASDIIVSTPLNTPFVFSKSLFENSISPSLPSTNPVTNFCIQGGPNIGSLYSGSTLQTVNYPLTSYQYDLSHYFSTANASYVPPVGFKGVSCLSPYYDYQITGAQYDINTNSYLNRFGNPTNNFNTWESTNVAQVKIQVGGSTSTTCGPDPVVGQVGSPFPSFYVPNTNNLNHNLNSVVLVLNSTNPIQGSIVNDIFIPDLGQIIPYNATLGLSSSVLIVGGEENVATFQTNFSPAPTGGVITVNTSTQSSSNSSALSLFSSLSSSLSSLPITKPVVPAKALELSFTKYNKSSSVSSNANTLDITDPYICEQQIITGNVKYTGDKKDLNPVDLKIKKLNANNNSSYSFKPTINENGDYQVDIKNIPEGNYQVEFSISDKLGNSDNGTYTFEKKDKCKEENNLSGKGSSIVNLKDTATNQRAINLTRTGGIESGFVYALIILLLIMFMGSEIYSKEIEE